jgi:RND family efflux transporter MFP subunit
VIRTCPTGTVLVTATLLAFLPALSACTGGSESESDASTGAQAPREASGVPVRVDTIRRMDLDAVVTAPGRTEALKEDRVRAPFASRVVSISVTDGDRVRAGQVLAEVVSKNSEAALDGAQNMLAGAVTATDSSDAQRAIEVARQQLVRRPLRAPADGVVLSHAAEVGDYVDEGEVLLTAAELGTVFFNAQVSQGDLPGVKAGENATIDLPAVGSAPVRAVVHGVLPSASSENLSAPVRLDFQPARPDMSVGLFGTADIVVGQHRGAVVVPPAAVLRDDVSGVSRLAVVDSTGVAHWVVVQTGIERGTQLEIVGGSLRVGGLVIVDGQVGLPDSSLVRIQP